MAQVALSILSADFAHLEQDCRRVFPDGRGILHFDVMDGVFVPNLSIGIPVLHSLKKALPQAEYDVHLMIIRPAPFIEPFAKAGADAITIHCEAEGDTRATLAAIRRQGCQAGLSLRPATPPQALFPLLPLVDQVLVMSVEPGFGGQAFLPGALDKLRALRAEAQRQGLPLRLVVDGGINAETAKSCLAAGADILVAGSAVFGAPDPRAAMLALIN